MLKSNATSVLTGDRGHVYPEELAYAKQYSWGQVAVRWEKSGRVTDIGARYLVLDDKDAAPVVEPETRDPWFFETSLVEIDTDEDGEMTGREVVLGHRTYYFDEGFTSLNAVRRSGESVTSAITRCFAVSSVSWVEGNIFEVVA